MDNYRFRIAAWVMRNRLIAVFCFVCITVFFAVGMRGLTIKTIFSDWFCRKYSILRRKSTISFRLTQLKRKIGRSVSMRPPNFSSFALSAT